jgi:hypothetical protein
MYQPPGSNNNGNEGDLGQPSAPGQQQQIPSLGFFNGQDVASIVASAATQNYGLMGESGGMDDPAQNEIFRLDKQAIYGHPLFPLLSCLLEKCELATCSPSGKNDGSSVCTAASFNEDLEEFVKLKAHEPSFYRPNPELDQVMLLAIRVLRIHLLELEKVHDLCDDFCRKYVSSLKQKIPVDVVNEERTGSGRPPSSMSSPSGTAGSSSSPIVGTPINMPMYPQSYDNHMAPSVDSHTSHNSSHPSNFQNQILDLQKNENPASLASNGHSSTDLTRLSSSSNHNNEMKPGHSHDQSIQDNNGYNSLTDNDYKPQITGLDGSSDAEDISSCRGSSNNSNSNMSTMNNGIIELTPLHGITSIHVIGEAAAEVGAEERNDNSSAAATLTAIPPSTTTLTGNGGSSIHGDGDDSGFNASYILDQSIDQNVLLQHHPHHHQQQQQHLSMDHQHHHHHQLLLQDQQRTGTYLFFCFHAFFVFFFRFHFYVTYQN